MPGHPVGESLVTKTIESIVALEKLVHEHDVIFMLTDSRESRWLPTLLGAHHNKVSSFEKKKNSLFIVAKISYEILSGDLYINMYNFMKFVCLFVLVNFLDCVECSAWIRQFHGDATWQSSGSPE